MSLSKRSFPIVPPFHVPPTSEDPYPTPSFKGLGTRRRTPERTTTSNLDLPFLFRQFRGSSLVPWTPRSVTTLIFVAVVVVELPLTLVLTGLKCLHEPRGGTDFDSQSVVGYERLFSP